MSARVPSGEVTPRDASSRTSAAAVLALGAVVLVVLGAWLVPWDPVPGGPLHPPSAGEVFPAGHLARAEAYSSGARWISRSALVVSLAVACLLGFTRLGRRLTGRLRGPWPLRVVQAATLVLVIGQLAVVPFSVAAQQRRLDAGLSTQTWGAWTLDLLLGLAVDLVATALALCALVACARRWRRAWPAVAGLTLAVLVMLGSYVYPVLVQPLFNDFRSLPAGQLRTDVLALAEREGVRVDDVLVADASRRTTTLNAYVAGFGSTRRVVLYDTLVEDVPRAEALAVVAHELAHAEHDDVLVGTTLGASGVLVGVGLLGLLAARRPGGVRDAGAVPYVLALYALASALATPVQNTVSRQVETRADVVALEATGDRAAFVGLQRRLALRSLTDPDPAAWSQVWFGSHPTVLQRIALAHRVLP